MHKVVAVIQKDSLIHKYCKRGVQDINVAFRRAVHVGNCVDVRRLFNYGANPNDKGKKSGSAWQVLLNRKDFFHNKVFDELKQILLYECNANVSQFKLDRASNVALQKRKKPAIVVRKDKIGLTCPGRHEGILRDMLTQSFDSVMCMGPGKATIELQLPPLLKPVYGQKFSGEFYPFIDELKLLFPEKSVAVVDKFSVTFDVSEGAVALAKARLFSCYTTMYDTDKSWMDLAKKMHQTDTFKSGSFTQCDLHDIENIKALDERDIVIMTNMEFYLDSKLRVSIFEEVAKKAKNIFYFTCDPWTTCRLIPKLVKDFWVEGYIYSKSSPGLESPSRLNYGGVEIPVNQVFKLVRK
ncbi:hypothetical protein DID76_03620 [Candidatus Marinamargulisbacteria bacterium SCGC AG-414-C22]|nr:hypothetical protein DID76_03620 [Candidatus Marinamargulisbacteria bacterium SCGC AG-414-C22]